MEHPLGVEPQMGLFEGGADAAAAMRTRGLGALACLPDEVRLWVACCCSCGLRCMAA